MQVLPEQEEGEGRRGRRGGGEEEGRDGERGEEEGRRGRRGGGEEREEGTKKGRKTKQHNWWH